MEEMGKEKGRERGRSREIREETKSVKMGEKGKRKHVKKEGTSNFVSRPSVHKENFHDLQARAALQSRNDGRCAYNSHHGSGRTD